MTARTVIEGLLPSTVTLVCLRLAGFPKEGLQLNGNAMDAVSTLVESPMATQLGLDPERPLEDSLATLLRKFDGVLFVAKSGDVVKVYSAAMRLPPTTLAVAARAGLTLPETLVVSSGKDYDGHDLSSYTQTLRRAKLGDTAWGKKRG
jgi:hypothetical protein